MISKGRETTMYRKTLLRTIVLVLVLGLPGWADRYIVRLAPNASATAVISQYASYGMTIAGTIPGAGGRLCLVSVPDGTSPAAIMQALRANSNVQAVEPDNSVGLQVKKASSPASAPKLPSVTNQGTYLTYYGSLSWAPYVNQTAGTIIRMNDAHRTVSGRGVIADIDTGVDPQHPALWGALTIGYDFTRNIDGGYDTADLNQDTTPILDQDTTPILDNDSTIVLTQDTTPILDQDTTPIIDNRLPAAFGHGTMVAGMLHLVAPTAKIMPLKAFTSDGASTLSQIVGAIYWAVDHGANVINMSFDTPLLSVELSNAIAYAAANNVICVASAGNDGQNILVYPAAISTVIGVASTTPSDTRSTFSNYGKAVQIGAPGEAVILPYPRNHYAVAWGTSFSSPQVAGAISLLLDASPFLSTSNATKAISQAAPVTGGQLGAGRLDLMKALNALSIFK
jgi:subtilisin family serine protease